MLKTTFILFAMLFQSAGAAEFSSRIETESQMTKSKFFIGPQFVQLKSDTTNILGYGAEIGYQYAFLSDWKLQVRGTQILNQADNTLLYTNFSGSLHYSVLGNFQQQNRQLRVDGNKILDYHSRQNLTLSLGAGIDHFLLSGTSAVFSGTGISALIGAEFNLWGIPLGSTLRVGNLTVNQKNTTYMGVNLVFMLEP